jgi:hypothetical protein
MDPIATHKINHKGILNISAFKLENENKNIFCQMARRLTELIIQEEKKETENNINKKKEIKIKQDIHSKLAEKLESSFYDEKADDSLKFENVPFGSMNGIAVNSASPNEINYKKDKIKKNRTSLKEEIEISQQFQQKIPKYFIRKNFDLMRIVEDQVKYSIYNKIINV